MAVRSLTSHRVRLAATGVASLFLTATLASCGGGDDEAASASSKPTTTPDSDVTTDSAGTPSDLSFPSAPIDLLVPDYDVATSGEAVQLTEPEIHLPGGTLAVESITIITETEDPDTYELVGPAEGEAFKVVQLGWSPDQEYRWTPPEVIVLVEDGGQTQTVGPADALAPFLVSASDEARLVLKVGTHDVTVPLTTGVQDPDPVIDVLDRPVYQQEPTEPLEFRDAKAADEDGEKYTVSLQATLETVELTPYLPTEYTGGTGKWAEPGTTFLIARVTSTGGDQDYVGATLTARSLVGVTATADGTDYAAPDRLDFEIGRYADLENTYGAAIVVPDSVTAVTLAFKATTELRDSKQRQVGHGSVTRGVTFE